MRRPLIVFIATGGDPHIRIRVDHYFHADPETRGAIEGLAAFLKKELHKLADMLDTVLARSEAQTTVLASIEEVLVTWEDERAALRAQVTALETSLGEAGNDTTQVAAILASMDANDGKLAAVRDKLAPAVVANTPAEEEPEV